MRQPSTSQSLNDLLMALPSTDVNTKDIKAIVIQLILDTGSDLEGESKPHRAELKLRAAKLLLDVLTEERRVDNPTDILSELLMAGK